ncbi:SGNH/GDSL hydrolase family protein [Cryobacterium sp. PH31-L1]|uniref:SGNH/GDSL hydrolase family protein n=1 Tax=Cryobacterium sp. PH31-L1 TaxID=3046199 RepID=UPI0024B8A315|nr:SGNH/GDSL hydrolase family protein [Cryobacterium sp. PH31-L1]MDJ0376635.1 SGNH/GDSL hydrolase family protein [Cryobacterium sp. PH31-L1]
MTNQRFASRFLPRLGAVAVITGALLAGAVSAPALAETNSGSAAPVAASAHGYVALGDSFTSGQGAPPYVLDGTACLRSKRASYPIFAAVVSPYRLVSNNACSGASTADVPAQLLAVSPSTALVTLTVGGIDAGSNVVLAACAPDPASPVCLSAINNSVAQLSVLAPKLVATYGLVAATLPKAKIAVLSYPRQFKPGFSPLGDVLNGATDALNTVIAGSVAAMATPRIRFVDASQEFAGHGIGSRVPYFAFDPLNPLAPANFHPNVLGNSLGYARALVNEGVLRRP